MGTALAVIALYVGLVRKGYLPRLSVDDLQRMVKSFKPWDNLARKEIEEVIMTERRAEIEQKVVEVAALKLEEEAIEEVTQEAAVQKLKEVRFGVAVRDVAKFLEGIGDDNCRKILTKVDKQELVDGEYYLTSLKPEWVQEVRDALKNLDISDSLIKKILILGVKFIDDDKQRTVHAITIITNFFLISILIKNPGF